MPEPNFCPVFLIIIMNEYQSINFNAIEPMQTTVKSKRKYQSEKCDGCKKKRKRFEEDHKFCRVCYISNTSFKPTGNKAIDDFIKGTQCDDFKDYGRIETVPYDQFKDIEFIAEGGFSRVYKATWVDGPIDMRGGLWINGQNNYKRITNKKVVLKKIDNSKNISF